MQQVEKGQEDGGEQDLVEEYENSTISKCMPSTWVRVVPGGVVGKV